MKRVKNMLGGFARQQRVKSRRLALEQVEDRRMMSVNTLFANRMAKIAPVGGTTLTKVAYYSSVSSIGIVGPMPTQVALPQEPMAVGTISYNASTRVLTIEGTDAYNDIVNVYINHRAGNGAGNLPDLLTVSLSNINTPQVFAIAPASVSKIIFNGRGGNDYLDDRTAVRLQVDAGAGNDVILGGALDDLVQGGDGDDFIDGRLGNDTLLGQGGVDAIFGDNGIDALYGGDLTDYLFGGNGTDYLYGEGGNDKLYGGADLDNLLGGDGVNTLYADYGPNNTVSASGFASFDWFDRTLKDPSVRSQSRVLFRDGVITRSDMLKIYTTVSTDGVESTIPFVGTVTTNEFADLKALTDAKINFQTDTRFFAKKVAFGDAANAHYQGAVLGNLAANVSGDRLNKLVDKWFKGGDVPVAQDSSLSTLRYERVQGSLFVSGPSFSDVDQGSVSDCYFLAALGEVAQHSQSTIQRMFADNGDNTWTVQFFQSGAPVYVTVNRMLPVLGNGFSAPWAAGWGMDANGFQRDATDAANELWVALAEKAYVQLNESGGIGQDGTNNYHGIDFGYESSAFTQISGKNATAHSLSWIFSPPGPSDVINALSHGYAMTLGTVEHPASNLLVGSHAYMVTGYNSATQMFQLYNPHGAWNNDAPGGGSQSPYVEVSWGAVLSNFCEWTSVLI